MTLDVTFLIRCRDLHRMVFGAKCTMIKSLNKKMKFGCANVVGDALKRKGVTNYNKTSTLLRFFFRDKLEHNSEVDRKKI